MERLSRVVKNGYEPFDTIDVSFKQVSCATPCLLVQK